MKEEGHYKGNREERRDRASWEGEGDKWSDSSTVGNKEDRRARAPRDEGRDRPPRDGEGHVWSEMSSVDHREDRRDRAPREERRDRALGRGHREVEGDRRSESWDYNNQIIEQVRERWTEEAMGRGPRERERAVEERFEHQRKDHRDAKTTWRGEEEGNRWNVGERKSSSRDADRRRNKNEVKSRNVVCHSISGGSSHQNRIKPFYSKKRESYSSPEQEGKFKRRCSGQSTSSFRSSPKPEKVKKEASVSLEELENALKMVEQEEEAVWKFSKNSSKMVQRDLPKVNVTFFVIFSWIPHGPTWLCLSHAFADRLCVL